MNRTTINALNGLKEGSIVKLFGWVETIRNQKTMQFLILRDHTGVVQVVHERKANGSITETVESLSQETVVEIVGSVVANPNLKIGNREILLESLTVINPAESPLPIQENSNSETKQDWRFLELRKPANRLIFEVQTLVLALLRDYWLIHEFLEINSPKLMSGSSEGGAELFQLEYFGEKACLAQSPQFYKQMAIAGGFEKVFEIAPAFRAELSKTSRHATEFISVDMEVGWINSHEDVMKYEEEQLHHVLTGVHAEFGARISETFGVEIIVPTLPFPRVTIAEAYEISASNGYIIPAEKNGDLDPEGERRVGKYVAEQFGHEFVFITDYPASLRPFYHLRPDHNPAITNSFDLLWKGVEITTGSQREHRFPRLVKQAEEKRVDLRSIQDYLNCFRYGMPPHGGYGLGLARLLMQLLGTKNVREVSFLFRGPNRLRP